MVVTIGCHLVMLMGLLRPVGRRAEVPREVENDQAALKVRFISPSRRMPLPPVSPALRLVGVPSSVPPKAWLKEKMPPPAQRVMHTAARPPEADAVSASPAPIAPDGTDAHDQYTSSQASTADGGFRERMLHAQHSQGIRGVPGSDRRFAQGIELTDPMDQGVGSVMRGAQRLFGVTNHHCIDVEAWQHLSPDELKARHLSAADVEKESEKYNCNRPLGLNF
jgi:hypothetical protein